ncbi:hypothetical protein AGMMS50256_06890 [Betaproteobacteria bacterium]|nr:hypothetical protein AGMMS50256_06890 [Betaproteobacteria bacterium]
MFAYYKHLIQAGLRCGGFVQGGGAVVKDDFACFGPARFVAEVGVGEFGIGDGFVLRYRLCGGIAALAGGKEGGKADGDRQRRGMPGSSKIEQNSRDTH